MLKPGDKFERLTVLKLDHREKYTNYYLCKCMCGKKHMVSEWNLKYGIVKSCGCLRRYSSQVRALSRRKYSYWCKECGASKSYMYGLCYDCFEKAYRHKWDIPWIPPINKPKSKPSISHEDRKLAKDAARDLLVERGESVQEYWIDKIENATSLNEMYEYLRKIREMI